MHSPAAPCPSPPARQSEQRCCCTQRRHQFLPPNLERVSAPLVAQHVCFNVSTPAADRERRCPEPGQQAGGGLCEMHEAALCQQPRHVSLHWWHRRHRHGTGLAGADRDGGASSRCLVDQLLLSHRPLHFFWAHTKSWFYFPQYGVQGINRCHYQ